MTRTRRIPIAALAGLGILGWLAPLPAQAPPRLAAGARVRVTAPFAGLKAATGTVRAVLAGEIVVEPDYPGAWRRAGLRPDSAGVGVPLDSVRSLDVAVGSHRHFLAGAGVGALLLGTVSAASAADCTGFICFSPAAVGAAGALAGGLLGGLIGVLIVTDE